MASTPWRFAERTAGRFISYATGVDAVAVTVHQTAPAHAPSSGGEPVAAWVNRKTGRVELVASQLGISKAPADRIDMMRPTDRHRNPVLAGAAIHEASHLAHTAWIDSARHSNPNPAVLDAARVLEEARCEGRHTAQRPVDTVLVRAATAHVVLNGLPADAGDTDVATTILGLVLPRVTSGVFAEADTSDLRATALRVAGVDGMDVFEQIWTDALGCADDDTAGMLDCGRRWVEATRQFLPDQDHGGDDTSDGVGGAGDSADDGGDGGAQEGGAPGGAVGNGRRRGPACGCGGDTDDSAITPSESADENPDENPGGDSPASAGGSRDNPAAKELRHALAAIRDNATREASSRSTTTAPPDKDIPDRVDHAAAARDVFGQGTSIGPGSCRSIATTDPTPAAVAAKTAVIAQLRRAQYRDATRVRTPSTTPAGKARGSALLTRHAQISKQQQVTATPWQRTTVRTVDRPPLHLGFVVDASPSMAPWFPHAGAAIWAVKHAVTHLGGACAAAAFAGDVTPIVSAAARPTGIPVLAVGGTSSGAGLALAAVDGELHLSGSTGARLVICLTDSDLPDLEPIQRAVSYLHRHGVTVVWAVTANAPRWTPANAAVVTGLTPENFPRLVTATCVKALAAAEAHR